MRMSLSRDQARQQNVKETKERRLTTLEIEEILKKKHSYKKVKPKERELTGYAGYCFNLHYGAWKS